MLNVHYKWLHLSFKNTRVFTHKTFKIMAILIIIGLVLVAVGFNISKIKSPASPFAGIIKIAGFIIIVVAVLLSSVVQVNPGEIGVQKLFGKVSNKTLL